MLFCGKEENFMEIVYNQYFKSGAKGTAFALEKNTALEFLEKDEEHHDIGFKYDSEDEARSASQSIRQWLKKNFSGGGMLLREA